jgi:hypothetical protein
MAGTGCKPRLARARRHKHKVSIDPIWTQATWAQRPVIDAIVLHASDRGTGPRLSCLGIGPGKALAAILAVTLQAAAPWMSHEARVFTGTVACS